MYHLPSEQRQLEEKAINWLETTGCLDIYEPCNCGSRIQHNNGGNYHEIILLQKDSGKYFMKTDTTCELVAPAEWNEVSKEDAYATIKECVDWLDSRQFEA